MESGPENLAAEFREEAAERLWELEGAILELDQRPVTVRESTS